MPVWIGTSGWQYAHWRGRFYPPRLAQARWLEYYAERFETVEVNNTFYRLPPPETFTQWAQRLPPGFAMGLKVSRYLTHIKRLSDPEEPVARFVRHAAPLGPFTGPLLLQLPPNLMADAGRLRAVLERFPQEARVAVECRHPSWFSDGVRGVLEASGAALVLADRGSRPVTPLWRTAPWGYVRLHGGTGRPPSCYGRRALASWAGRMADLYGGDADVFVYFNNDGHACALRDAITLAGLTKREGLRPTRVPPPGQVAAG